MPRPSGPGRKPKRLFVRFVRFGPTAPEEVLPRGSTRKFIEEFDRVGRLVAHGPLTDPPGDLLVYRAADFAEADRLLRKDPFRRLTDAAYQLLAWHPTASGSGVSLEPPPARGSGRLTLLRRVSVVVSDQPRAIQWYRDVLGLKVLSEDVETQFVALALGPGATALSLVTPRPEWGEPFYSETRLRLGVPTGVVFQTDSVDALELRLRNSGVRITRGVETQPWGERTLQFSDPDGNEFLAFDLRTGRRTYDDSGKNPRARGPQDGSE